MGKLKDQFMKVTEVKLSYKNPMRLEDRPIVTDSLDAYELFSASWDKGKIELQEEFKVMFLDNAHSCLGIMNLSSGGIDQCLVDAKLVFASALKARATAIIVAHNHPTGNLHFSEADRTLTRKLVEIGHLLNLPVLDHLIVTPDRYLSYSDVDTMPVAKFTF
ncbi:JAB domain-containing protein [Chryseobacterium mucoviscidosis]|uniref:JAB domain-containing protein n=1 Tax=Chryseobacterium mucoviscidosis TaxID=1945581 RepID=UPI0031E12FFC